MLLTAFFIVATILFILAAGIPGIPAAPVQLGWLGLAFCAAAWALARVA